MYRFYEEKEKIREIQKYLFVTESGYYDEKTREAVKHVQKLYGFEENGEIDYYTFTLIYGEYLKKKQKDRLKARFPEVVFPLKINSYSDASMEVNKMLILLSNFYGIETNLRYTDYYGERSEKIIEKISDIYDIVRVAGEIDENTYEMLEKDFRMIRSNSD